MTNILLHAEKWVNNGYTISHANNIPYFIKGLIPGESGNCAITKKNNKFAHATIKEIAEFSKDRIDPECSIYPECGGCSFRHISYEKELELKKNLLKDAIFFGVVPPKIEILANQDFGYRNNVQLKIKNSKLGFYKTTTNEIIELPKSGCRNLAPELNQFIIENRQGLALSNKKEIRLRITSKGIVEYSDAECEFILLDSKFMIPKNGFYQINQFLIEPWLKKIRDYSPKVDHMVEFFSGSGIISVILKDHFKKITGYELDKEAVKYASKNARKNDLTDFKFQTINLYEQNPEIPKSDFWIFNPPRNGLNKLIIDQIKNHQPEYILYSSCNYITLARDLKDLLPYYKKDKLAMIDFFPRTPYFETLIKLVKN